MYLYTDIITCIQTFSWLSVDYDCLVLTPRSFVCICKQLTGDVRGKKVAYLKEGFDVCEPDVVNVVTNSTKYLEQAGVFVQEVSLPAHHDGMLLSLQR